MSKKYHLKTKPVPPRFVPPGPFGIIEGDGCLNCANCVKKSCIYLVYRKREYDKRQMFDTADALCKNCFRCIQGCYGRILSKSANPEYWSMGDDYWTPEIIAANQMQAETGKIPVSGGGYGGPFSGADFDSMWTDMSEIVRPTRDGIHGREFISTSVELGRIPKKISPSSTLKFEDFSAMTFPPRVETSIPLIFDLLPFREFNATVRLALARAAQEANTFMILRGEHFQEDLWPFSSHLVPLIPAGPLDLHREAISRTRMVQIPYSSGVMERITNIKSINPQVVVSVRLALNSQAEEKVLALDRGGVEVIHLLGDEKGREQTASFPRFLKEVIRKIHLRLVTEGRRDGISLIYGGGIALAEHLAKAIICGADSVSLDRPLLIAWECRLCGECTRGRPCPMELEQIDSDWGRQRVVNLIAAWHGQLLEVLGAMGLRDVRRLRGETGRAIFREDIEKETFAQIFGTPTKKVLHPAVQSSLKAEVLHVLAS